MRRLRVELDKTDRRAVGVREQGFNPVGSVAKPAATAGLSAQVDRAKRGWGPSSIARGGAPLTITTNRLHNNITAPIATFIISQSYFFNIYKKILKEKKRGIDNIGDYLSYLLFCRKK